ncbi:MAG TPA: 5-(carboxyamino)imidazole ribonucleotide synthase [Flavobacteriaceae bacterium]|nr:5-(carboxyamino)imidazole ribonucleotide synthase [Flavobacteriaceae bacterium]
MTNYFSSPFTLAILGGGQLGKMLLYETRKWDVRTKVLDPSNEAPCRIACDEFVQGDLMDYDTVYQFAKNADVVTIEIENVNKEALEALEKEGKKVYPSPKTLRYIQDKGIQKQFYRNHDIPTSDFQVFENKVDAVEAIKNGSISLPTVWKSRTGGYDGRGVQVIRTKSDLNQLPDVPCLLEDLIPFETELAVSVARNAKGETKVYPVVEMEFHPEANQVEYVLCPARIDEALAQKAQEVAKKTSKALNHIGLLAVELFATKDGQILVNEVAPRTHNSGHYSIEGSYTNQFEQHLRAILNLPLGKTDSIIPAIMVNLSGAEGHTGPVIYENIEKILSIPGVTPHIYGKKETRPFRKMGHITIVNKDISKAREIAEDVNKTIRVLSK